MANMIDLKRAKPPKEQKSSDEKDSPMTSGPSYEERPYCLRFTLEKPELEKLGKQPKDFSGMEPIAATVMLDPITIRDNESKSEDRYNENSNKSVEFQVLSISFGDMTAKKAKKFDTYADQQKKGPGE